MKWRSLIVLELSKMQEINLCHNQHNICIGSLHMWKKVINATITNESTINNFQQ